MIAIIDLGIGNLANVQKALNGEVTTDPIDIKRADKIVIPGVGNFGAVVDTMDKFRNVIGESVSQGKPTLGICLGMQLLFEESEEEKGAGLGIFPGRVVKFREVSVPHIGWNQLRFSGDCPLLGGIDSGDFVYFVHSYYVEPEESDTIVASTDYQTGENIVEFPSIVWEDNVYGVQFHPEKSGKVGLQMLDNFKEL